MIPSRAIHGVVLVLLSSGRHQVLSYYDIQARRQPDCFSFFYRRQARDTSSLRYHSCSPSTSGPRQCGRLWTIAPSFDQGDGPASLYGRYWWVGIIQAAPSTAYASDRPCFEVQYVSTSAYSTEERSYPGGVVSHFRGILVQPSGADYDLIIQFRGQGPPPESTLS